MTTSSMCLPTQEKIASIRAIVEDLHNLDNIRKQRLHDGVLWLIELASDKPMHAEDFAEFARRMRDEGATTVKAGGFEVTFAPQPPVFTVPLPMGEPEPKRQKTEEELLAEEEAEYLP